MILQELRYGIRSLRKNPGFALTSIFMLALGIGATTAIFAVVDSLLLKSLPFQDADRIITVREIDEQGRKYSAMAEPNFRDLKTRNNSFEAIAQVSDNYKVLVTFGQAQERSGISVISGDFFDVMKVQPVIGRTFSKEEQHYGGPFAIVVSERFVKRMMGGRTDLSNLTINVNGKTCKIVGILSSSFDFPKGTDVWASRGMIRDFTSRTSHNYPVIGRLKSGVSFEQAQAESSTIAKDLRKTYGEGTEAVDFTLIKLHTILTNNIRESLWMLFGATALLLLISCANYSNLLLARFTSRQTELSIRTALGATGLRMIRQTIMENLLTAVPAAVIGCLIAYLSVELMLSLGNKSLPPINDINIDYRVIAFCCALAIVIAVLTAIITTLRYTLNNAFSNLIDTSRGNSESKSKLKLRSLMVVTQICLTFMLLSGSGLLIRSFMNIMQVNPGFKPEDTLVMNMSLPARNLQENEEPHRLFYSTLRERISNLPGVIATGNIDKLPMTPFLSGGQFQINNDPLKKGEADYRVASNGYFEAMRVPLLRGRLFTKEDTTETLYVALISKSFAEKYWPGKNPIGETIKFGDARHLNIIGIVGDIQNHGLESKLSPTVYANSVQQPQWIQSYDMYFVIHSRLNQQPLSASLRSIVNELRPDTPISFQTMDEIIHSSSNQRRFNLVLFSSFAAIALLIAALGLYGVLSYTVEQRAKEIGIRTALGAEKKDIIAMIIRHGAMLAVGGAIAGIIATIALSRFIKGMLFGVSETDMMTLAVIFGVMLFTAIIACYLPARRAANVNPLVALRE